MNLSCIVIIIHQLISEETELVDFELVVHFYIVENLKITNESYAFARRIDLSP